MKKGPHPTKTLAKAISTRQRKVCDDIIKTKLDKGKRYCFKQCIPINKTAKFIARSEEQPNYMHKHGYKSTTTNNYYMKKEYLFLFLFSIYMHYYKNSLYMQKHVHKLFITYRSNKRGE